MQKDLNTRAIEDQRGASEAFADVLRNSSPDVTDADFEQALSYQLAHLERPPEDLEEFKTNLRENMQAARERMRFSSVEVLENGSIRALRNVATGTAHLKAGGDGTNFDDYIVDQETQEFSFHGTGAVKLGQAGNLFSHEFDIEAANEQYYRDQERLNETVNEQYNHLVARLTDANDFANDRYDQSQADIQRQVEFNQMLKDLVESLAQGGTVGSFFEGKIKSAIEEAFERATGIPGGFLTGVMSGMKPNKALESAFRQKMLGDIEQAIGIPGLGGFLGEQLDKSQARTQKHKAMRGLGGFNPVNIMRHTHFGQTVSSFEMVGVNVNPFNPLGTLSPFLPEKAHRAVAQGLAKVGQFFETQSEKVGTAFDAVGPAGKVMGVMTGVTVIAAAGKEYGRYVQGQAHVVARGANNLRDSLRAMEEADDYETLEVAFAEGARVREQRLDSYRKMTAGGYLKELMKPLSTLVQAVSQPSSEMSNAEYGFREGLATVTAKASGLPLEYLKTLFTGGSLEDALWSQAYADIENQFHIPGLGDAVREHVAQAAANKAKHQAGRVKPEDFTSFGLTYAWRTSEHNKTTGLLVNVAETVAGAVLNTVGNIVPGAGTAIWMGYNIAKQAYMGSLHGGTKGALAGYLSGAVSAVTGAVGVSVNGTYDFENGWGLSIGANVPGTAGGVGVGGSINIQEGQGVTGTGINIGYEAGRGYRPGLGVNFDGQGNFAGANFNVRRTIDFGAGQAGASVGINLGADGRYSGFDVSADFTREAEFRNHVSSYTIGGGLSYNRDGSFSINTSQSSYLLNDVYHSGLVGVGTQMNDQFLFNRDGGFDGTTENIQIVNRYQTEAEAQARRAQRMERIDDLLDSGALSEAESAALSQEYERLYLANNPREAQRRYAFERAREILADETATDEEKLLALAILQNPDPSEEEMRWLASQSQDGQGLRSPEGFLGTIAAGIDDFFREKVLGQVAMDGGFLDPQTGEWRQRTCFVAGTLVRVRDGYRPIEELRNGDEVLSFNEEMGRLEYRTITEVFVHTVHELYEVSYDDGTVVETTWNHPFLVEGRGWVEAKDLRILDRSHTAQSARSGSENRAALLHGVSSKARFGGLADARAHEEGTALIRSVRHVQRTTEVYNIHLDGAHTYFVTKADVLVHNYRVESGDTLDALAARFQVSRAELLRANPWLADNPDLIRTGEILLIPGRDDALIAQVEAEAERLYDARVAELQARHPFSKALMDENGRVFGFIGRDGGHTYLYTVEGQQLLLDDGAMDTLGFETGAVLSLGGASLVVGPAAVAEFVAGAVGVHVAGNVAESYGIDRQYVELGLIIAGGVRALFRRTATARVVAENARRAEVAEARAVAQRSGPTVRSPRQAGVVGPRSTVPRGNSYNYRGEPVRAPQGHKFSDLDPPMSALPRVRRGPFTEEQRAEFLRGRSSSSGLAPHHRHQLPVRDGGVIDEIPASEHIVSGRHPARSVFNNETGGNAMRRSEIRAHWRAKGARLVENPPGSGQWFDLSGG